MADQDSLHPLTIQRGDILTFLPDSYPPDLRQWEVAFIGVAPGGVVCAALITGNGVATSVPFPTLSQMLDAGTIAYTPLGYESTHAYRARYTGTLDDTLDPTTIVGRN